MTTLITGAGLVGTSFAIRALDRGEKVVFLDPIPRGDYLDSRLGAGNYTLLSEDARHLPGVLAAIEAHGAETVLHTTGLIGKRAEDPLHLGMDLNINATIAVCEAVRLAGVRRLLSISTFGSYDWRRTAPDGVMKEDFPLGSGTAYSNTKAAQELILEAYSNRYGFEVAIVRPANVFGMGHFWGGSGGGEKCHTLVESGIRGVPAKIPGRADHVVRVHLFEGHRPRARPLRDARSSALQRLQYRHRSGDHVRRARRRGAGHRFPTWRSRSFRERRPSRAPTAWISAMRATCSAGSPNTRSKPASRPMSRRCAPRSARMRDGGWPKGLACHAAPASPCTPALSPVGRGKSRGDRLPPHLLPFRLREGPGEGEPDPVRSDSGSAPTRGVR